MISIYKVINKINDKLYIGQTSHPVIKRFKKHVRDAIHAKRPYAIHLAIRKYGPENFNVILLDTCETFDESNRLEQYYIELLKTLAPNGYNLRSGGDNSPHSEASKEKNRVSHLGKTLSIEHRRKIGLGGRGRIGVWKGKQLSEKTKRKMSQARIGKPGTNNRKVICVETEIKYDSLTAAAKDFKVSPSKIFRVCAGQRKTTRGHSFKYVD